MKDGDGARTAPVVALNVLTGVSLLLASGLLAARGFAQGGPGSDDDTLPTEAATEAAPDAVADAPRGGMIPRGALVDTARSQSAVLCSSEAFLGCMGFDGTMCLSLSESAIERCLMPLPEEIDPSALDSETLESCPRLVYERAGYDEPMAKACFEKALDES